MKKKQTIILSAFALILLLVAMIGLLHCCHKDESLPESGGLVLDTSAEPYDPSASLAADSVTGIAIPGYGDIYFPAGETDVQLTLVSLALLLSIVSVTVFADSRGLSAAAFVFTFDEGMTDASGHKETASSQRNGDNGCTGWIALMAVSGAALIASTGVIRKRNHNG